MHGTTVTTPGNYPKPKQTGGLTVALKGESGYVSYATVEVNHKFQVHLFLRSSSFQPHTVGFYTLEGSIDGVTAGRFFFDYNGVGWFQIIGIRLLMETYLDHLEYVPTSEGDHKVRRSPVKLSFVVLGPIPSTRQRAYGEVFVLLECKACQV